MIAYNSNMDALLKASANSLLDEDIELFDSIDTSNTKISDKAIRRIRRKIKNYGKKTLWESIPVGYRRVVAAILICCTVSFGLCMSISAIREEVVSTFLEWYDKFVSVFYVTEETPPSAIEEYREPRLQLNGTEKQTIARADTLHMIHYYGENGLEMGYQQLLITDSSSDIDNKNCSVKEVQVNKNEAQLFSYEDGSRTIVWHDNEYAYSIISYTSISSDLIIAIAESVK